MTTPGFRKRQQELDKLITTPWLKDRHPFTRMNPKPLKKPLPASITGSTRLRPRTAVTPVQLTPNKVQLLQQRDGNLCWLCHIPLGVDISLEHLVASSHGGPNHMSNYVLVHKECNRILDVKSVAEKVRLREALSTPTRNSP